jgi:DNA-binding transcriptional LysR family regulator
MSTDIVLLRTFIEVARSGSFTEAAARLRVSQPAITKRINRLEHATGLSLFERTTRTVKITPQGRRLYEQVRKLVDAALETEILIKELRNDAALRLKVGAIPVSTELRLGLLEPFLDRHPDARIEVTASTPEDVRQGVRLGELDAGFDYYGADEECDALLIYRSEMGLLTPAGSPLFGKGAIERNQLRGQKVALYPSKTDPLRHEQNSRLLRECGATIVACPEWTIEGLAQYARQFQVPTLVTPDHGPPDWPTGPLAFRPFADLHMPWDFYMICSRIHPTAMATKLWRILEYELREAQPARPLFERLRRLNDVPVGRVKSTKPNSKPRS